MDSYEESDNTLFKVKHGLIIIIINNNSQQILGAPPPVQVQHLLPPPSPSPSCEREKKSESTTYLAAVVSASPLATSLPSCPRGTPPGAARSARSEPGSAPPCVSDPRKARRRIRRADREGAADVQLGIGLARSGGAATVGACLDPVLVPDCLSLARSGKCSL